MPADNHSHVPQLCTPVLVHRHKTCARAPSRVLKRVFVTADVCARCSKARLGAFALSFARARPESVQTAEAAAEVDAEPRSSNSRRSEEQRDENHTDTATTATRAAKERPEARPDPLRRTSPRRRARRASSRGRAKATLLAGVQSVGLSWRRRSSYR